MSGYIGPRPYYSQYLLLSLMIVVCVGPLMHVRGSGSGILREDNILLLNTGIKVPLGRSVYLTQNELQIRVAPGDRCTVTVLDNDPLALNPGHIMPRSFPCDFGPEDVVYSHFGSHNPPFDRIRLQVGRATHP